MAFKSVEQFNDARYHGLFRLVNDKDHADVIFLYRSMADMLVADAHYIKSSDYSGYVHCCGAGCPACAKGIRVQNKLFIPVYNIRQNDTDIGEIQFWDRNMKFEPQIEKDVFNNYPNPSEFIFSITRNGVPNDIETNYSIKGSYRNTLMSYDEILAKFNAKMPDYYSEIIRDIPANELAGMLQNADSSASNMPEYTPIPRAGYQSTIPNTFVNAAEAVNVPSETPVMNSVETIVHEATSNNSSDDGEITELPDPVF